MLIRIVRMHFHPENVQVFIQVLKKVKPVIETFPGCMYLEVLQDAANPNVYYTYSHWTNETALENYRDSSFFQETWANTKVLFASKAQAFSLKKFQM